MVFPTEIKVSHHKACHTINPDSQSNGQLNRRSLTTIIHIKEWQDAFAPKHKTETPPMVTEKHDRTTECRLRNVYYSNIKTTIV